MSNSVSAPLVSIIVPARNEEASLGACLESLVAQTGISFEVIVVDDHSTDRTAEIAHSFPAVQVTDAPDLLPGWTGKTNAVMAAAGIARGNWFLFTDADTVHLRGSLANAVAEAQQHGVAMLSYSPQQEVRGFWEKAVMPLAFAELARVFRPKDVSDPSSPIAAANGQYLLISREAYQAVGGHAVVAGDILEDVALARRVKSSGFKIFFRYGGDAVRTRMYRSFSQMREGWTKNLAELFSDAKKLAILRLNEFFFVIAGVGGAILFVRYRLPVCAALSGAVSCILYLSFLRRVRKAHFSWDANLCAFLGLPVFAYLLLRSALFHKRGNVEWKGRAYTAKSVNAPPEIKLNEALLQSSLAKHKSNY